MPSNALIVCFCTLLFQLCSAHENDYLNTQNNQRILNQKLPISLDEQKMSFLSRRRDLLKRFSFREEYEDRMGVLKSLETGIRQRFRDEQNQTDLSDSYAQCNNDTQWFVTSARANVNWAVRMFDSFGKPGSDTQNGNFKMMGSYDECLTVKAKDSKNDTTFRGMYCTVTLYPYPGQTGILAQTLTVGACMPDSCSSADVGVVINEFLVNQDIKFYAVASCQERDYALDTRAIFAIVVCSVFGALIFGGTCYDIVIRHILKKEETSSSKSEKYETKQVKNEKTPLLVETSISGIGKDPSYEPSKQTSESFEPGILSQIILSFSAYTNGAKLLNTKLPTGSLTAIHGIRVISMTWVILGHCYMSVIMSADAAMPYIQKAVKRWTFQAIMNATPSVDTFFAMSGLLVTFLTLKEMKKRGGKVNWFMFYFHRYWRLTPVYMLVLMIFTCLFHYMGDGPMWAQKGFSDDYCSDTWWTNMLYVNNLVKRNKMCIGWSWYLANDMQFYVISPLILVPLFYFPLVGYIVMGIFLLATLITAGVVSRTENIAPGIMYAVEGKTGEYNDYYMTPYCRMGPYIIGMAVGYIMYKTEAKAKMNKISVILGWALAAASALAVIYGPYESANGSPLTKDVSAFYNAIHRTVWGAAVCWVVYACATGNGGFVNTLMSWKGFVPLSRLSYSAYLIHLPIEMMYTSSLRSPPHMNDTVVTIDYLGMLLLSYMVAFVVCLTFEAPMMGLEKAILKRERRT